MNTSMQHVLCIDDEVDILEVAQLSLETVGGLKVTCLSSGQAAIEQAEQIMPDLILLDVMMPVMNGPATLKALRGIPALNHIPIVFMTARVQPAEVQEYMSMGAAGVTPKPFDPMTLASEINGIWERCHVK